MPNIFFNYILNTSINIAPFETAFQIPEICTIMKIGTGFCCDRSFYEFVFNGIMLVVYHATFLTEAALG